MGGAVLIIGVGNPLRRDDGLGRTAARAIRQAAPGIRVLELEGEGASLLEAWAGADVVVVIDAVRGDGVPGRVHRFEPPVDQLPRTFASTSTHAFGLPDAVELGQTLGQLPRRLIVYGIEGADFTAGEGLSSEVDAAVPALVSRVMAELEALP
jgi:hydrogenase maturation protease